MRFSFRCLVKAIREMSTDEDKTKAPDLIHVKTANRMSTGVDKNANIYRTVVEAVRKIPTKVSY